MLTPRAASTRPQRTTRAPQNRRSARPIEPKRFISEQRPTSEKRPWDRARAAYARLLQEAPRSERARRATFDLAAVEIESGNREKGYSLLREAMLKQPNDGLARRAFERYVEHLDQSGADVLAWLRDVQPKLVSTESTRMFSTRLRLVSKKPEISREPRRSLRVCRLAPVSATQPFRRRALARLTRRRKAGATQRGARRPRANVSGPRALEYDRKLLTSTLRASALPHRGTVSRRTRRPRVRAPPVPRALCGSSNIDPARRRALGGSEAGPRRRRRRPSLLAHRRAGQRFPRVALYPVLEGPLPQRSARPRLPLPRVRHPRRTPLTASPVTSVSSTRD